MDKGDLIFRCFKDSVANRQLTFQVYGSRYGVYEGTNPVIVLANAEDVNEVCVTKAERFEAKKVSFGIETWWKSN